MKKSLLVASLLLVCSVALATQDPGSLVKCRQASPDGKKVGDLAKDYFGARQLFVKNIDGSNLRQITFLDWGELPGYESGPGVFAFAWSPDSTKVACLATCCDRKGAFMGMEKGYNEAVVLVINLSDLTTTYVGGRDMRSFPAFVNISQLKWINPETVQYNYKLSYWDNQDNTSSGTVKRNIKEGRLVGGDEFFFRTQVAASTVAKMIVNKKPIFAPECPVSEREFLEEIWEDPKLWITEVWLVPGKTDIFSIEVFSPRWASRHPIEEDEDPAIYFLLRQGKITMPPV